MNQEETLVGYRWIILVMSYVGQLSFALIFQSIPPILRLIILEQKITYSQAGLLMSLFGLPGIIIAIPIGIISDRFDMKKVGMTSLVLMIIGTFVLGISDTFLLMVMGRFVSGIGAITLGIIFPPLLSRWFIRKELGLAMGVVNTCMPLGIIISFNVLSFLGVTYGWRTSIFGTTIVSIVALVIFVVLYKKPSLKLKEVNTSGFSEFTKIGMPIWLVGLTWMWFNAMFISFFTFAQDFFVLMDYEVASASILSSIIMVGAVFLSPLAGYITSRFGKEQVFIMIGGIVLAALILSIPTAPPLIPILVLMGIFSTFITVPIFSLPSKIVKPEHLGLAFGILTTCGNIGVLLGPYLVGLVKDLTNEYTASFYLMSCFSILVTFTTILLHFKRRKSHPL